MHLLGLFISKILKVFNFYWRFFCDLNFCVTLPRYRFVNLRFLQPNRCYRSISKLICDLKGGVGFSKRGRSLVRRVAPQTPYFNNFAYSTRFYTKNIWLTSAVRRIFKGPEIFYLTEARSSKGVLTLLPSVTPLFSVSYNDPRFIINSNRTLGPSKSLFYFKLGSCIRCLRDVFSVKFLWASSPGSVACINYFDKFSGFLNVSLPSGKQRFFFFLSRAYLTSTSNLKSNDFLLGEEQVLTRSVVRFPGKSKVLGHKAGLIYSFGYRPRVRGVAMNPVDHPHGGRTKSIRLPKTPWGKVAKLK